MDIIQRCLLRRKHISGNPEWNKQTWKQFEQYKNRKIFVFGGIQGLDYFLEKYGEEYKVECFIDNDINKNGKRYDEFSQSKQKGLYGDLLCKGMDELLKYKKDEIVVIIASTNYYEEIAGQLEENGITDYFILCIMEAKRWKVRQLYMYYIMVMGICQIAGVPFGDRGMVTEFWKNWRKYPIQQDKIVFNSFRGREYTGHCKYITEALIHTGFSGDIVWLVQDMQEEMPSRVRKVDYHNTREVIHELATARIWVVDVLCPIYVRKRKGQYYIQVKHWAGVTLKKFYLDTPQGASKLMARKLKQDGRMMDYVITGSKFDSQACKSGMGFKGECIELGSPRTDALFRAEGYGKRIREMYSIPVHARILMYAPTFRRNADKTRYIYKYNDLDMERLAEVLELQFGGTWYIFLRLHPNVRAESLAWDLPERIINVSFHKDSQELIAASDVLISDFSSIMFESAFVRKPVFIYATDVEECKKNEWEFLIDLKDLPFTVAANNDELEGHLKSFDQTEYEKKVSAFLEQYGVHEDGHASERAAGFIQTLMEKK